ncbi:hypothetical protein [Roseiterribacter gracilis]|uniref:Uncharacterized protein n=1 Tax=Roseiterribacter gracilis TaxID=2812848 RepID=A0A8S8XLT5_9PROT|nr:hypothetical protein TMPK1_40070 [Rhodospirillales bacterium TMPK1]
MRRVLILVAALLLGIVQAHAANEPACGSKLCQHLVQLLPPGKDGLGPIRRWEDNGPFLYSTIGLSDESANLFGTLLEDFGRRAGLSMQRATPDKMRFVRIVAVNTDDPNVRANSQRVFSFAGANVTVEQAALMANISRAILLYKQRWPGSSEGKVERCGMFVREAQMKSDLAGFILGRQIFQCLTSFGSSEVLPSILNWKTPPRDLIGPATVRLSVLDEALLRLLYARGHSLFGVEPAELVAQLEARLRADGFRDDGSKQ